VSDGVHDNLDPQHHGVKPKDVGLSLENWEENVKNVDDVVEKKARYTQDLLDKMFKVTILRNSMFLTLTAVQEGEVTPLGITSRLLEHARNITKPGRVFMEEHPNKRIPR